MKTKTLPVILILALTVSLCTVASAQVRRVSDGASFPTLMAAHNDPLTFAGEILQVTQATLFETDITFSKPLTIDGLSNILDGANASAAGWTLGTLTDLTVQDLTIQNDLVRGIFWWPGFATEELNLNNVTMQGFGGYHIDMGGAGGIVSATNSLLTGTGNGIAMAANNTHVTLDNTAIQNISGGYGITVWAGTPHTLTLQNGSLLETNVWSGIYDIGGVGIITLDDSSVLNQPNDAIWIQSAGTQLILKNGARISGQGTDAIRLDAANLTVSISDSLIADGVAGVDVLGSAANAQVTVVNSTIHDSASGIVLGVASGVVDASYSIISTWDTAGFDNSATGTATDSNNVYVDNDGFAGARINVTAGPNTVDSNSTAQVFCSTDSLSAVYLHIGTAGPAYDIDGLGNNAGAFPASCTSPVEDWKMY